MPPKSLVLTTRDAASHPSDELVRLVEKSAENGSERGIEVSELVDSLSMSYAPHLDRRDVRVLVDRLAFA